jgi:drug/metabolite transporter (DMT)-like permease
MFKGILLILCACLIWGLIFVIPGFMVGFSPLEVALCRYSFLSIISSFLFLNKGFKHWRNFSWAIWQKALLYALLINIIYYFSLVSGLRYANASIIALIAGMSPITLAFYGNWSQKEGSYQRLVIPSLLIGFGIICINGEALMNLSSEGGWEYGFGLLCGLFSLVLWNWYIVANAQLLKQNPTLSSSDWSTLLGIGTFVWVILIVGTSLFLTPSEALHKYTTWESSLLSFIGGGLILGFVCSWLGSYLWNVGSQKLPISLAGQLTIFETIFGLIFVYLVEQRFPDLMEFLGIITVLSGIGLSMFLFRKPLQSNLLHSPS